MSFLKVEYVNHFLDCTAETLDTMMDLKLQRYGTITNDASSHNGAQEITSIICLMAQSDFIIRLILKSPVSVAVRISAKFLAEEQTELNMDVIDSMKEIVNIIAGAAAAKMSEHNFSLTLPVVLIGSKVLYSGSASDSLFIPLFIPECGRAKIGLTSSD